MCVNYVMGTVHVHIAQAEQPERWAADHKNTTQIPPPGARTALICPLTDHRINEYQQLWNQRIGGATLRLFVLHVREDQLRDTLFAT